MVGRALPRSQGVGGEDMAPRQAGM